MAVRYCDDFPGECCDSCHEDFALGDDYTVQVFTPDDKLYAVVCCKKMKAAQLAADASQPRKPETQEE